MVVSHVPLQTPGGPELLVIALVILIPLAFIAVLVVGVFALVRILREDAAAPDRVAELERRVDELERHLDGEER